MRLKEKLSSRKFWVTAASVAAGLLSFFSFTENIAALISAGLMALVPTVIYIITEGKVDAASASSIADILVSRSGLSAKKV